MRKIIKFFKLKLLETRLLRAYKKAIIEEEANEIKYRVKHWYDRPFFDEVEKLLQKWHKVRYDN